MFADLKIITATVEAIDDQSGFASLETPDKQAFRIFLPSYFGGNSAPYPQRNEEINLRVSNDLRVISAWK